MKYTNYMAMISDIDEAGISHSEFARICNSGMGGGTICQTTISRIKTGEVKYPRVKTGAKMIKAYRSIFPKRKLPMMEEAEFIERVGY